MLIIHVSLLYSLYVQTSDCTYHHLFIELSLPATTIPALDNAGSLEPQAKVKIVGTFAATEPKNCPGSSGYGCMDGTGCGFPLKVMELLKWCPNEKWIQFLSIQPKAGKRRVVFWMRDVCFVCFLRKLWRMALLKDGMVASCVSSFSIWFLFCWPRSLGVFLVCEVGNSIGWHWIHSRKLSTGTEKWKMSFRFPASFRRACLSIRHVLIYTCGVCCEVKHLVKDHFRVVIIHQIEQPWMTDCYNVSAGPKWYEHNTKHDQHVLSRFLALSVPETLEKPRATQDWHPRARATRRWQWSRNSSWRRGQHLR